MGSQKMDKKEQRILRLPDVVARVGMSRSAIYARMASGQFPRSVNLGGYKCVGWLSNEIDDWIASRPVTPGRGDRA